VLTVAAALAVAATALLVGVLVAWLRRERAWGRALRSELAAQSAFADGLAESLAAVSSTLAEGPLLERAAAEAHSLLGAEATLLLTPSPADGSLRPFATRGLALRAVAELSVAPGAASPIAAAAAARRPVAAEAPAADELCAALRPAAVLAAPLVVLGEVAAVLVLMRLPPGRRFRPHELSQAALFADFAARAAENARLFGRVEALLSEARLREAERAELSRRVLSVEQDERRRLSLYLHDGPLQTMSGIAMMLDGAAEAIADGDPDAAARVLTTARTRQRSILRSVRELSFALEPWTLRDRGFTTAVRALADEIERCHDVRVTLDVDAAETLEADAQVLVYQIAREAMQNAVKHAEATEITLSIRRDGDAFAVTVADDGEGIAGGDPVPPDDGLPHHGVASMRERAAILGGELRFHTAAGEGTAVELLLPARAGGDRVSA
jgi:signal transduction histidine kinase